MNQTPDYCTSVTGWRFWKIRKDLLNDAILLNSVIRKDVWTPMERFTAKKTVLEKPLLSKTIPEANAANGVYAYKTIRDALTNADRFCYRGTLLGTVHLWGIIHKHRFGFRAQYAYPASFEKGICCICKTIVSLHNESFAFAWTYYHFSEDFSVYGFLCEYCNEKYYSLELQNSFREFKQLTDTYGINSTK